MQIIRTIYFTFKDRVALEIPEKVALMLAVPAPTPVATPEALMVATAGVSDVQIALEVMSKTAPLEKVAVAKTCWVDPTARSVAEAVMLIDEGASTASAMAELVTPGREAVILAVPPDRPVARPLESTLDATESEFQVTIVEIGAVELSEYVPVAVNC